MNDQYDTWDLVVVGAGSGGIGAALAGARMGLRPLLVEQGAAIGGTAVHGGVHVWEPGVGGTGLPFDIYTVGSGAFPAPWASIPLAATYAGDPISPVASTSSIRPADTWTACVATTNDYSGQV